MNRSYKNLYGLIALIMLAALLSSCAPYQAHKGTAYFKQRGKASWYGPGFAGRKTANGERFNPGQLTAAHKKLPFNTTVRVTNLDNHKSVIVRINDRGPFVGSRIIDLSKAAAKKIGLIATGTAMVEIETVSPAKRAQEIAAKAPEKVLDAAPGTTGVMLAARGPVRKNGVEHLIELDTANENPVQSDAPELDMDEAASDEPEPAPVAAKPALPPPLAGDSIEDGFMITSATNKNPPPKVKSVQTQEITPSQAPEELAAPEAPSSMDEEDF